MNTIHLNQIGDKVIVKKGQGGGGSEGGSVLTYYRFPTYSSIEEVPEADAAVVYNAVMVRSETPYVSMIGANFIGGGKFNENNILYVRAFAIDKSARYIMASGGNIINDTTIEAYLLNVGVSFSNYEEITKEEFYAL